MINRRSYKPQYGDTPTDTIWKQLRVSMPDGLFARLQSYCDDHGITMSSLVRDLIVAKLGPEPSDADRVLTSITKGVQALNSYSRPRSNPNQ